ncbi:MAG: hypothetical protein ACOYM2_10075 [Rectinemataceae bacterium]
MRMLVLVIVALFAIITFLRDDSIDKDRPPLMTASISLAAPH